MAEEDNRKSEKSDLKKILGAIDFTFIPGGCHRFYNRYSEKFGEDKMPFTRRDMKNIDIAKLVGYAILTASVAYFMQ